MTYEFEQIPYPLVYEEQAAFKDTYGGAEGVVVCESYLLRPKVESDTVLVFMHPVGGGAYLPMVRHLARSGHHVIYCNSRFRGERRVLGMAFLAFGARVGPRLLGARVGRVHRVAGASFPGHHA